MKAAPSYLDQVEVVYLLGIGGIGMSALARYFKHQGKFVLGYDKTRTALTIELEIEGMELNYQDSAMEIPELIHRTPQEKILVIYTPAIPKDSALLNWFYAHDFRMEKRSAVLGLITLGSPTIAVAGTHGKTTTSCLIAHLLQHSGRGCNAFLGGISTNYGSNLIVGPTDAWTVVEADEYDRSFLTLSPTVSVITSMDADHLDIYGNAEAMAESYQAFADRLNSDGQLFYRSGLPLRHDSNYASSSYGMNQDAEHSYAIKVPGDGRFLLEYKRGDIHWTDMELGLPGIHNAENAVAAIAVARHVGLSEEEIRSGLSSFRGVRRRFEYRIKRPDLVMIDDYAHHPEEIRSFLASVRLIYPGRRITGVFQPHLFTRTRDFLAEFAEILSTLDEIILLEIYPARELPIAGIDSQLLLDKISNSSKRLVDKHSLLATIQSFKPELLVMMGAGDIDALVPQIEVALVQ